MLRGLLEQNFKVLVVTTDVGGSGTSAVKIPLRMEGRENLLDNLYEVVLDNDEEFQAFLQNPKVFFPDIYTWDPDFLFWDGAAGWQQVYLSEKIGEIPVGRDISAAVESGLVFEQPQWGAMRNGTFRGFHKFCSLHNRETGKIWHKIVTCQEGLKSQKDGANSSALKETHMPLLQGAGGQLIGGAFDLIIRTKEVKEAGKPSKYVYQVRTENSMSKVRGFKLDNEIPADFGKLWTILETQGGYKRNTIDEDQKVQGD